MKRQSFLILVSILFLANYHPILAAPGDSIAEAFTANLGEQQGTLDAYNDVEYYNFTGETYKYYNFTLVPDPSNYNTMRIYDNQFNLIDENFTGNGPKTLVLNGYENYTIAIYASEFMEIIPGDYSLFITETNGYNTTAGATQSVDTGSYNGTLELYNDVDWYNFSGSADREYNFLVTHPPSLITLLIYDSDLNLVKSNWTVGTINSINQTGKSSYLIAVASSEFVELPINYTLTITDLTPTQTTTSSSTSTSNTISSTANNTVSSTTGSTTNSSETTTGTVPLNWYSIIFAVVLLPIIKKRK